MIRASDRRYEGGGFDSYMELWKSFQDCLYPLPSNHRLQRDKEAWKFKPVLDRKKKTSTCKKLDFSKVTLTNSWTNGTDWTGEVF